MHATQHAEQRPVPQNAGAEKKAAPKGTLRRDPLWTLAGKLPTGLRDKVPFQECKRQRPPTVGVSRVPVPISALRADTAKALGLTVPPSLIARADEVIE
jgi:hypothetical protein